MAAPYTLRGAASEYFLSFFFFGKSLVLAVSLPDWGVEADKDICIPSENHLISKLNLNEKQIKEDFFPKIFGKKSQKKVIKGIP